MIKTITTDSLKSDLILKDIYLRDTTGDIVSIDDVESVTFYVYTTDKDTNIPLGVSAYDSTLHTLVVPRSQLAILSQGQMYLMEHLEFEEYSTSYNQSLPYYLESSTEEPPIDTSTKWTNKVDKKLTELDVSVCEIFKDLEDVDASLAEFDVKFDEVDASIARIDASLAEKVDASALDDYYNKAEVDEKIADVSVDLSDYYTKEQVDASLSDIDSSIDDINEKLDDLDASIKAIVIPTKVSELENDASYINKDELDKAIADVSVDLSDYYTKEQVDASIKEVKDAIPTVPTNVSAFTNDAGYLTEHQSLDDYYTKEQVDSSIKEVKDTIPTVPTNVSAFTNDASYINKDELDKAIADVSVDLSDYYTKEQVDASLNGVKETTSTLINNLTDSVYTKAEIDSKNFVDETELESKGYLTSIPSEYVTDDELESKGYAKDASIVADYYNKTEVNTLIGNVNQFNVLVVESLPSENIDTHTIYLVPKSDDETNDVYDEYIYINNAFEHIGSTQVDLSDYYTKEQVDSSIKEVKDAIPTVPTNVSAFTNDAGYLTEHQSLDDYYTKEQIDSSNFVSYSIEPLENGGSKKVIQIGDNGPDGACMLRNVVQYDAEGNAVFPFIHLRRTMSDGTSNNLTLGSMNRSDNPGVYINSYNNNYKSEIMIRQDGLYFGNVDSSSISDDDFKKVVTDTFVGDVSLVPDANTKLRSFSVNDISTNYIALRVDGANSETGGVPFLILHRDNGGYNGNPHIAVDTLLESNYFDIPKAHYMDKPRVGFNYTISTFDDNNEVATEVTSGKLMLNSDGLYVANSGDTTKAITEDDIKKVLTENDVSNFVKVEHEEDGGVTKDVIELGEDVVNTGDGIRLVNSIRTSDNNYLPYIHIHKNYTEDSSVNFYIMPNNDATKPGNVITSANDNFDTRIYLFENEVDLRLNGKLSKVATVDDIDASLADYYKKEEVDASLTNYYTKEQVDTSLTNYYTKDESFKIVTCTQAEYDALETKDANTLYCITDA